MNFPTYVERKEGDGLSIDHPNYPNNEFKTALPDASLNNEKKRNTTALVINSTQERYPLANSNKSSDQNQRNESAVNKATDSFLSDGYHNTKINQDRKISNLVLKYPHNTPKVSPSNSRTDQRISVINVPMDSEAYPNIPDNKRKTSTVNVVLDSSHDTDVSTIKRIR